MDDIQQLCNKLSSKIVEHTEIGDKQQAVISYGLFAILHTLLALIVSLICAGLLGIIVPTLIITIVGMSLRKYSGGAHASKPIECMLISLAVTLGGGLYANRYLGGFYEIAIMGIVLFMVSFYIVARRVPVDSAAKPITNPKKKKMLKKKSYLVLIVDLFLVILMSFTYQVKGNTDMLSYTLCIYIGVGWQVFTLTKVGHQVISWVDFLFNKLFYKGVN